MKKTLTAFMALAILTTFNACKKDEPAQKTPEKPVVIKNDIPEFFLESEETTWGVNQPTTITLLGATSPIAKPTDLDFNPTRKGELWIVNEGTDNTGGSTVMVTDLDAETPKTDYRKDQNSWHFMALPTALAFSENGDWATSSGILDANRAGGTFTGPALWSGDLSIYAKPSGGNGSHLDMLHGSPYSMGIASENATAFWVFDGYNKHIVRYDFWNDHGPGNADHDDGRIQRFTNIAVKKNGAIPSHLVMDKDRKFLYAIDGGNNRVLKIDVSSATKIKNLPITNEKLADHSEWNADFEILASDEFFNYCGIAINGNRLFVGDFDNGNIRCIDLTTNEELGRIETGIKGMTGLAIYNDQLYFVSYKTNSLYKIIAK
jgi:hypothetical protein